MCTECQHAYIYIYICMNLQKKAFYNFCENFSSTSSELGCESNIHLKWQNNVLSGGQ